MPGEVYGRQSGKKIGAHSNRRGPTGNLGGVVPHNRDPVRSVRVSDELWRAAGRAVQTRGDQSLSHVIRGYLAQYVQAATESKLSVTGRPQKPPRVPTPEERTPSERDDETP